MRGASWSVSTAQAATVPLAPQQTPVDSLVHDSHLTRHAIAVTMRIPTAVLALPAGFLVSLVLAVPSPSLPPYDQQAPLEFRADQRPLLAPPRSRWTKVRDSVVEAIFGFDHEATKQKQADRAAPAHNLARYGNDVLLRFNVSDAEEVKALAEAADTLLLDVWEYGHDWVDIRLAKDIVGPLLGLLPESLQNAHAPLLGERELAQAIWDTYPVPRGRRAAGGPFGPGASKHGSRHSDNDESNLFFSDYQPLSVLTPWLHLMASLFPTHVRALSLGTTASGRPIPGLRVGVHPTLRNDEPQPTRKTVLVTGGSHAREWISTSTVSYLAYTLITAYGKAPAVTKLLEQFDFVFVPSLNPDGYAYTFSTDRLWRKNRQSTGLRFCQGLDIDRSFDFHFEDAAAPLTTRGNPCSEAYAGEAPFEAAEARALAEWARNETARNAVDFVAFLDLHSYSQQILYPYSFSCAEPPPGLENLQELAYGLVKAIRNAAGHDYEVLPACEGNVAAPAPDAGPRPNRHGWPRMQPAGGSALDWFYHAMRVKYAYQIKLRDRGTYGFLLPRSEIVPTGREVWEALLYMGGVLMEAHGSEAGERAVPGQGRDGAEAGEGGIGGDASEDASGVVVEDVPGEEAEGEAGAWSPEDARWDLRRRRRR